MAAKRVRIAAGFSLPLDAVTETFSILGKRGTGKTSTAVVMVEEMLRHHQQVVVVDPTGAWWGLRSSADGKDAGYQVVILGGQHGDLPLEADAGVLIADLVVDQHVSLVLDLSDLRKGDQRKFNTAFLERLYERNRDPLHVVLDEADTIAPQRPVKGAERLLGAAEDLVRRGRIKGLGVTLITQRPAVLHKDVLTQTECLVSLRLTGPQDRAALDAWIKQHGDEEQRQQLLSDLAALPTGTAWFWSPSWLAEFRKVKVRQRRTFDSSATPKVGAKVMTPDAYADVDLDVLRERMDEYVKRAEASDPRRLQKRIRELEREVEHLQAEIDDREPEIQEVEVPKAVASKEAIRYLEQVTELIEESLTLVERANAQAHGAIKEIQDIDLLEDHFVPAERSGIIGPTNFQVAKPSSQRRGHFKGHSKGDTSRLPRSGALPAGTPAGTSSEDTDEVTLRAGARRMLQVLARPPGVRLTRAQIATLARLKPTSGTFSTYWSNLTTQGLIAADGDRWIITERGLDYLGEDIPDAPRTTEEIVAMWREALRAGAARMLDVLVEAYPKGFTREELAEAVDMTPTSGTFSTYLSNLRSNGLAEVEKDASLGQVVRAGEALYID